jgi:Sec-independent protein translocase protein TatA
MDGILGIGLPEMVIIAIVLLIVGGPKNSYRWARQLGQWVRQINLYLAGVTKQLEREMGPDGQELINTVQQLRQPISLIRDANRPQSVQPSVPPMKLQPLDTLSPGSQGKKIYPAWLPEKIYPAWLPPNRFRD